MLQAWADTAEGEMYEELRDTLQRQTTLPEERLDLTGSALLIARSAYPSLDPVPYLDRLAHWAQRLSDEIPADSDVPTRIAYLNRFVFEELGFQGDDEDYYNPRNSFLNDVLDRRRGIPITLALVYMDIGRRIGLELEGVSFPGHFLVKMTVMGGQVVLDPFNGGVSLDEDDLRQRLHTQYGHAPGTVQSLLHRAGKRDILVRMLRNLKGIYRQQGELQRALEAIDLILTIDPHLDEEYRDRGLLFHEVDYAPAALRDLRHYLVAQPEAEDAARIRELIIDLQREPVMLH
jgi:regulator of sirC expression with transglutaminase-like and TPR domain